MKRFISGGILDNNIDIDTNIIEEKEKAKEDEEISNFYKNSTFSLNTKLPKRLNSLQKNNNENYNNTNIETISPKTSTTTTTTTKSTTISFYCNECESEIKNTHKFEHETSITHILSVKTNENFKPKRYVSSSLPKTNVGYQILSNSLGWTEGDSLGSNNEGKINPIKVEKKNDKTGLGAPKFIKKTQQQPTNYMNKKQLKKNKKINKDKEEYLKSLL